jgi:competence protein ComEA
MVWVASTGVGLGGLLLGGWLVVRVGNWPGPGTEAVSVSSPDDNPVASESGQVVVEVSGAVGQPGVYSVSTHTRIVEVLHQAGGVLPEADPVFLSQKLNLAEKIKDAQKIFIPFSSREEQSSAKSPADTHPSLLSINDSSLEELMELPGIGEGRAQDIIKNRPYLSLEEVREKAGLSVGGWEKIRDLLTL